MRSFAYARPESLNEALALLGEYGPAATVLAGGTDIVVRLRTGRVLPAIVIDLKRVPDLQADILETDTCLRVGARTVMTDLVADERVRSRFPALAEAAQEVGSVQIRNRATLAGNICNASPAADTATPLLVYGAVVNLVSATGTRSVRLEHFFSGPGQTVLQRGELVGSIDLPLSAGRRGAAFARATRRLGVDLATINLACLVKASGQTLFAYGAVARTPLLVSDDSGKLADVNCREDEKLKILEDLIAHATPISDVRASHEYREALLMVMSRRVLDAAIARLHGQEGLL
ncbi:MAG: FAD binding domain-containing protein [Terracidiphilus sp.]